MGKMPGDRWLSGPGVPEGEMGLKQRVEVRVAHVGGDAEPRHVDFDDPPGECTPEEYEEILRGLAAAARSSEEFAAALIQALAMDMIFKHQVDPGRAIQAAREFAERLYSEAHPDRDA